MAAARLPQLDGLRGLAACGVAFGYHAQFLFVKGAYVADWGGSASRWLQTSGWILVDLFFVLSGFIFAQVYLPGGKLDSAEGRREFAVARIARLYPLHLLMLLVTAAFVANSLASSEVIFAAHLLMMQAFAQPIGHSFVGPSWSISVEAVCYLVFAFAAARGMRALGWITGAIVLLGAAKLLLDPVEVSPGLTDPLVRGLVGFFVGQALWRGREALARIPTALLWLGLGAAFAIPPGGADVVLPFTLLGWPCAVLLALRGQALGARPFVWLGDRSYAIYLIHMPLIDWVPQQIGKLPGDAATVLVAHAALIGAVLLLSDLTYRGFERPARRLVRGWLLRQPAAQAAAA